MHNEFIKGRVICESLRVSDAYFASVFYDFLRSLEMIYAIQRFNAMEYVNNHLEGQEANNADSLYLDTLTKDLSLLARHDYLTPAFFDFLKSCDAYHANDYDKEKDQNGFFFIRYDLENRDKHPTLVFKKQDDSILSINEKLVRYILSVERDETLQNQCPMMGTNLHSHYTYSLVGKLGSESVSFIYNPKKWDDGVFGPIEVSDKLTQDFLSSIPVDTEKPLKPIHFKPRLYNFIGPFLIGDECQSERALSVIEKVMALPDSLLPSGGSHLKDNNPENEPHIIRHIWLGGGRYSLELKINFNKHINAVLVNRLCYLNALLDRKTSYVLPPNITEQKTFLLIRDGGWGLVDADKIKQLLIEQYKEQHSLSHVIPLKNHKNKTPRLSYS